MMNSINKIFFISFLFISNICFAQRGSPGSIMNGITTENATEISQAVIDGVLEVIPGIIDGGNAGIEVPPLDLNECVPDFSITQNLNVTNCDSNLNCVACYEEARLEMNFFRSQLGRLNCIYQNTKKYKEAKVAFGDGASGIHAMTAIAWQKERIKINASFTTLQQTYDRKYAEFIEGLHAALLKFDLCERQYGNFDWYAKVGFIYYDMMKERYKRMD